MAVRRKRIQELVDRLLRENEIEEPPVNVEGIAKAIGIHVRRVSFGEELLSGFIYRDRNRSVIGVNKDHSANRQRFTIAHEIGHYFLHKAGFDEVHVDRTFVVRLRNELSSEGTDSDEIEANAFAAQLLMPASFLHDDLVELQKVDVEDAKSVEGLAKRYKVSSQALLIRLTSLGYLEQ
jgi:Zn-dependent peptidase ImmA (M78 family)